MTAKTGAEGIPSRNRSAVGRPIVQVEGLTVRFPGHYGDVAVLDDVSFELNTGETLGLVGESGSGKSLLSAAILGLLPSSARISGRILLDGIDVVSASERQLSTLRGSVAAPVFQDALVSLNPSRTIFKHFDDVWRSARLEPRDGARRAAEEALELAALSDIPRVLDSYAHELSGGMRQRALIALALLRRPSLLIADEPTTALDRAVEVEVLRTLRRLQRDLSLSIILVSHDMDVVAHMCSRIAVLYGGQLCEIGGTADVLASKAHPYTDGLLTAVQSLRQMVRPLGTIGGVVPHPSAFPAGCRFRPRCPRGGAECQGQRPRTRIGEEDVWCFHPSDSSHGDVVTAAETTPEQGP
jgi:oligopeptide/dipeptide ABC transporter ATP-binding protein